MNNRLAIGTAQFGLCYGIANQSGQVSEEEASAIIKQAWAGGIDTLDTAMAYDDSEQRLGAIGVTQWRVVTKLPEIPQACTDVAVWVQKLVSASLGRLRIPKLYGLLLHRPQQLLGPQGEALYRSLLALKNQNLVEKIGISIYEPDELRTLRSHYQFDIVQAPFNVIDRRLATTGWLESLHQADIEVHVRSIFLQGLLLMNLANLPQYFSRWQFLWDEWHHWLSDQSMTALQACLCFVLSQREINRVVVGVDSLKQLQDILNFVDANDRVFPEKFMSQDSDLINPSHWTNH